MRTAVLAALLILACMSANGCGYTLVTPGAGIPAQIRTVHVARIDVGESGDVLFGDALQRELRAQLRRNGRFMAVEDAGSADAVLAVRLARDRTRPVGFDEFDEVLLYDSTLVADARLDDREGNELWKREGISLTRTHAAVPGAIVTTSSSFQADERIGVDALAALDTVQLGENRRSTARERLGADLAHAIYTAMMEGF